MDNEADCETMKILLVEDNHADIRMIQEVFKDFKTKNQLYTVKDGIEALEFLNKKGKYKNAPHPDLILLDLNLPRMNGHELLKKIKNDDNLKKIPIIILTTSDAEIDKLNTSKLQVNGFITKPLIYDDYKHILQHIKDLWFE